MNCNDSSFVVSASLALLVGACSAAPTTAAKRASGTPSEVYVAKDVQISSVSAEPLPPHESQVVLFSCEHGVGRSAIAAAHFNRLAQERKLPYRAVFRGAGETESAIPPAIQRGLKTERFDVAGLVPAPVSAEDVRGAELVVVIDTELPTTVPTPKELTRWSGIAGPGEDYSQASAQLRQRVEQLVAKLAAVRSSGGSK